MGGESSKENQTKLKEAEERKKISEEQNEICRRNIEAARKKREEEQRIEEEERKRKEEEKIQEKEEELKKRKQDCHYCADEIDLCYGYGWVSCVWCPVIKSQHYHFDIINDTATCLHCYRKVKLLDETIRDDFHTILQSLGIVEKKKKYAIETAYALILYKRKKEFEFCTTFYGSQFLEWLKKELNTTEIKDILMEELPEVIKNENLSYDNAYYYWKNRIPNIIRKNLNELTYFPFEEKCSMCKNKELYDLNISEYDECPNCFGSHCEKESTVVNTGNGTASHHCFHCGNNWFFEI